MLATICSRTDFVNLQGLYNHARIAHKVEWGNHEECLRACAVPTDIDEVDLATGAEISSNVLPSIRSIFERAVERHLDDIGSSDSKLSLAHTLGLHADTPALAPFLGKVSKRRVIRTWCEDEDIDIHEDLPEVINHRWKKSTMVHGIAEGEGKLDPQDVKPILSILSSKPEVENLHLDALAIPGASTSRFYVTARIIVTDRCSFIPEGTGFLPFLILVMTLP